MTIQFGLNSVDERDGKLCRHSIMFGNKCIHSDILRSNHAQKDLTWKLQKALQKNLLHTMVEALR